MRVLHREEYESEADNVSLSENYLYTVKHGIISLVSDSINELSVSKSEIDNLSNKLDKLPQILKLTIIDSIQKTLESFLEDKTISKKEYECGNNTLFAMIRNVNK